MYINFRQGIISYPTNLGQQTFLSVSGENVSLIPNESLYITFTYKTENYLFTEPKAITNAWTSLTPNTDHWLYWSLDRTTGVRTFGSTTLEPIVSLTAPTNPALGQHWFNTKTNIMYVFKYYKWLEVVRVFAAKVNNTTITPLGTGIPSFPFAGTQVGITEPMIKCGYIVTDSNGHSIVRQNGTILTSNDALSINGSYTGTIRSETEIFYGVANEQISAYNIVKVLNDHKVSLAHYNDTHNFPFAIAIHDCALNQTGIMHLRGIITNPSWNFATVGAPLWVSTSGQLTETNPFSVDPYTFVINKPPIAYVLTPVSILFNSTMGGKGIRGTIAVQPVAATDTTFGIAKLSVPPTNSQDPIWVGTNDPRLNPYVHPATHPATMITTASYNFLTGSTLQLQSHELNDRPLSSLSNVVASHPSINNFLTFNGTNWVDTSIPLISTLNDLTDVVAPSPTINQILKYDGSNWIPYTPGSTTLTSDATGTGTNSIVTTLATVNPDVGSFGDSSHISQITVNSKGLITAATQVPIATPPSSLLMSVDVAPNLNRLPGTVSGNLWGWGANYSGQLGDGTVVNKSSPVQIGALTNWSQITCGYNFTTAIRTDGTLWTWGDNTYGHLGLGDTTNRSSPTQVGSLTNWKYVAPGYDFVMAIKTDGTLWSWGLNSYGELGVGDFGVLRSSPIQVGSLTNWKTMACGRQHTAAIKTDGTLWTWGSNFDGELGTGNNTHYSSPVQVGSLTNWYQVTCGEVHVLAIKTDGTLWAWGQNIYGQLGLGDAIPRSSPVQVGSLTNWKQIESRWWTTMAVKTDGTLWGWGGNFYGETGVGDTNRRSSPVQIGALTTWKMVATGTYLTSSIKTDGTLWTCGYNSYGELGIGNNQITPMVSSPVQVGSLTDWVTTSCGYSQVGALRGTSYAGEKDILFSGGPITAGNGIVSMSGTLSISNGGTSATTANDAFNNLAPVQTNLSGDFLATDSSNTSWQPFNLPSGAITSGGTSGATTTAALLNLLPAAPSDGFRYALTTNGANVYWMRIVQLANNALFATGSEAQGELGNGGGTLDTLSVLTQIGTAVNWKTVSGGVFHTGAIRSDGTLWTWGFNQAIGNPGVFVNESVPVQVGSLTNWSQISCGFNQSHAIKTDGTLWAWGQNPSGGLGDGTTNGYDSPVQIGALTNWAQVSSGNSYALGVRTDGTLWAWGDNTVGELGVGDVVPRSSPVQVGSLTTWKQAATSAYTLHWNVAIRTDGTMWAWGEGNNIWGQFASGSLTLESSPVQVGSLSNWKQVACGYGHWVAIKTDGTLWACGYNVYGQLGDGTLVTKSSPVQIGIATDWATVECAQQSSYALKNDGTMWACGYDNYTGVIGNGLVGTKLSSWVQIGTSTWTAISSVAFQTRFAIT